MKNFEKSIILLLLTMSGIKWVNVISTSLFQSEWISFPCKEVQPCTGKKRVSLTHTHTKVSRCQSSECRISAGWTSSGHEGDLGCSGRFFFKLIYEHEEKKNKKQKTLSDQYRTAHVSPQTKHTYFKDGPQNRTTRAVFQKRKNPKSGSKINTKN